MSFVGKILVVFVLAASLVFMSFAAAVYTSHKKWRDETFKALAKHKESEEKNRNLEAEVKKKEDEKKAAVDALEGKLKTAEDAAKTAVAQLETRTATEAQLRQDVASKEEQLKLANEQAIFRQGEAEILREQTQALLVSRNKLSNDLKVANEQLKSKDVDLSNAIAKNVDLNRRNGQLTQLLSANKISLDAVADAAAPPPPVEGNVLNTQPPKSSGGQELVEISLGGDDRLRKGHTLSVFRSALKTGGTAKYLGKIQLVQIYPDHAVGRVVERAGQTKIQKGDNVTTKL